MPNLTSVERLAKLYEDDAAYFSILYVRYHVEGQRVVVEHVTFAPIEWLSWDCLTLGALGHGQIQISNANYITVVPGFSRRQWMLSLCPKLELFYVKEAQKIATRRLRFEQLRLAWEQREDPT